MHLKFFRIEMNDFFSIKMLTLETSQKKTKFDMVSLLIVVIFFKLQDYHRI